jgi:hypothetical protein
LTKKQSFQFQLPIIPLVLLVDLKKVAGNFDVEPKKKSAFQHFSPSCQIVAKKPKDLI